MAPKRRWSSLVKRIFASFPVPYARYVEEVELHMPRFGLEVRSSEFALAREGADVAISGRNLDKEAEATRDAIQKLGRRCALIQADYASPEQARGKARSAVNAAMVEARRRFLDAGHYAPLAARLAALAAEYQPADEGSPPHAHGSRSSIT